VRLIWYNRDLDNLHNVTIQMPFDVRVKRYSWDVYGGPRELEASIEFPGGSNFSTLWALIQYLRSPVELFDWRGVPVWWGFLDKITINDGVRSFGIALDNMFNRVKATYELLVVGDATGLRADTTWYEDTISSDLYGVKEKVYSMTSYSIAAAEQDAQTRLEATKYPVAIAELAAVADRAITVELLFSGWWKIINWLYYSETDVTYSTIAEQLVTMAEMSEFVEDANVVPDATTLVPDFRQGDELLLDEILKLMEAGTDNGRRILGTVDRYRRVFFTEEPEKHPSNFAVYQYFLDTKNRLTTAFGGLVEPTECRVGVWAHLRGYELVNGFEAITSPSPVFIERATYEVETGEYQPESFGYKSPFDELQSIQR
jgi:hypothetical protein